MSCLSKVDDVIAPQLRKPEDLIGGMDLALYLFGRGQNAGLNVCTCRDPACALHVQSDISIDARRGPLSRAYNMD